MLVWLFQEFCMFRSKLKTFFTLLNLVVMALLVGACQAISPGAQESQATLPPVEASSQVIAEGKLVPRKYVNLSFNSGGQVAELLVEEGQQVEEGQVLAGLAHREQAASAVAKADLELLNARQALKDLNENADVITAQALQQVANAQDMVRHAEWRLDSLKSGSKQVDIDSAQADVVLLKDQLDQARKDFARYENKPEDNLNRAAYLSKFADAQRKYDNAVRLLNNLEGSAGEIDLDIAEANLSVAQARLEIAQQQYEDVKSGPDPDDLAAAEARVNAAQAALEAAQAAQDDLLLKAPFAGTVVSLNLKAGEQVAPGQPAVVLADFSGWMVETDDLTEMEVPRVQVGQMTSIVPDALPDLELAGRVESISDLNQEISGDVTYTAKIALQETDPLLRWGMTVMVTFEDQ
jgi:multidrug resistance efflux pump